MRVIKYNTIQSKDGRSELMKERSVNYQGVERLNSPSAIYQMLCDVFRHDSLTEEYLYMLCFDNKYKLLGVFEVSHGTVNSSFCNPREIFMKALLCNASMIVLAHNHPSGDVTPSREDMEACRRIKECGDLLGVALCDNLIIGNTYYSFVENGMK